MVIVYCMIDVETTTYFSMSTSTQSPDSHVYSNLNCCCDVRSLFGNSLSAADFPSQNYYECEF